MHELYSLANVQDEPRPRLARSVLLGARIVTAVVVGSGALLGRSSLLLPNMLRRFQRDHHSEPACTKFKFRLGIQIYCNRPWIRRQMNSLVALLCPYRQNRAA